MNLFDTLQALVNKNTKNIDIGLVELESVSRSLDANDPEYEAKMNLIKLAMEKLKSGPKEGENKIDLENVLSYRGRKNSGPNSVIDNFGLNDDDFDRKLNNISSFNEISSFQPSYITSSPQTLPSSFSSSSSSSSSSLSSSSSSKSLSNQPPKFLPINIIASNANISDKNNVPLSAITREIPSFIDPRSLSVAVMRNGKLNSLDHLNNSDKEFLAKFGPFFDVLYHKFSPNQVHLLNDTINHLPPNLFSDYTIPPKRNNNDIKAFSIQKQVLALAQELTLIFREMKMMINVRDSEKMMNNSLDKASQILVLAG
jgi:hypothetical protein